MVFAANLIEISIFLVIIELRRWHHQFPNLHMLHFLGTYIIQELIKILENGKQHFKSYIEWLNKKIKMRKFDYSTTLHKVIWLWFSIGVRHLEVKKLWTAKVLPCDRDYIIIKGGSKEVLTIIELVKQYKIAEKCLRSFGQSTNTFIALLLGYTLRVFMTS